METAEQRANRLTAELRLSETRLAAIREELAQRDRQIEALRLLLHFGATEALEQLAAILKNMEKLVQ